MAAAKKGWITIHPDVMVGKPCIRGTRITVEFILELLAAGWSIDYILDQYEHLTREGVVAVIEYGASTVSTNA